MPPKDWRVIPFESSVIGQLCRFLLFQNFAKIYYMFLLESYRTNLNEW